MPDTMVALVRFLEQGNGALSKRAKKKNFRFKRIEINDIENKYQEIFIAE
jgi:hypothetical protein